MKVIFNRLLIAAILFAFACVSTVSAQVKITFNPEKGKKYEFSQDVAQTVSMLMQGQKIPMDNKILIVYNMEILDKTAAGAEVSYLFKRIEFKMSGMMMNIEYSTDNANPSSEFEKSLAKVLKPIIGKSFQATITPDGKTTELKGVDKLLEGITTDASNPMAAQLKQQFSGEALTNMLEQTFGCYPKTEVKVGDTWDFTQTAGMAGATVSTVSKCTLKSISGGTGTIGVTSDVKMNMTAMGNGQLAGTQTGTTTLDVKTGIPLAINVNLNVKGKISANNMDMDMEILSKITSSTKEIK